jgi:cell division protein FtsQ
MKKRNKTLWLKKVIRSLPVLLGVIAVVYAGFLIKDIEVPTVLPVNDIQVKGELHFLDRAAIEATVRNNISGDYFTVDLNKVREIIMQEPWVENVSLRRQWPASLSVFVDEQVPVAYWNDDGYINKNGIVFKPSNLYKDLNLPKLNGPEGQHTNVWKFMNVLYRETALLNFEVVRLDLDDRRAWRMVIASNTVSEKNTATEKNYIDVKLGRFDTEKRMQRFISILPALSNEKEFVENKIKAIDMRYPNGFAVRRAEKDNSQTRNILPNQNIAHNSVYQHAHIQVSEA